jgi:hypothetical protein
MFLGIVEIGFGYEFCLDGFTDRTGHLMVDGIDGLVQIMSSSE